MKRLFLVLFLSPAILFCQNWEKTYGGEDTDKGRSVQQTMDEGYIITGYTNSYGMGWFDVYLIKTDNYGDTVWTRTYGGEKQDYGYDVQQTTDGGYVIVGSTVSFGNGSTDIYLIKTDNYGDTLWTKTFGQEYIDMGSSVQQTSDEGFIITGDYYFYGLSILLLIKTDNNGDELWTKYYTVGDISQGYSVQQTSDGGFIVTGAIKSFGNEYSDVYLMKTDNNGDTLWTRTYGGDIDDNGSSVQQTSDGGYIIAGMTESFGNFYSMDVYLIKTDINGDTLWTKTYGGDYDDRGFSVQQTADGGYIITGYTESFGNGLNDVYLIKTNNIGDTLWTKTFGGNADDQGISVQQTTDFGYIITGYTESFGTSSEIYLIKTDQNGIVTFSTEIPALNPIRKLIKIVDLSGREISKPEKNKPYIEIYDDGTIQKKMKLK